MVMAYLFSVLALLGLLGLLRVLPAIVFLLVGWFSTTYLQLVLLPIIMVGQNQAQEASDARAEATFRNSVALEGQVAAVLKALEPKESR